MLDALCVRKKLGKSDVEKKIPSEKPSRKVSSVWLGSTEQNDQVLKTE